MAAQFVLNNKNSTDVCHADGEGRSSHVAVPVPDASQIATVRAFERLKGSASVHAK